MRAIGRSALVWLVLASAAVAQTPAVDNPAPASASLTPKEIADLRAQLSSIDRKMGKEWVLVVAINRPDLKPLQLNNLAAELVRQGNLVTMQPISAGHRQLQLERAEIEARLLAAGQKVRNMSRAAEAQQKAKH